MMIDRSDFVIGNRSLKNIVRGFPRICLYACVGLALLSVGACKDEGGEASGNGFAAESSVRTRELVRADAIEEQSFAISDMATSPMAVRKGGASVTRPMPEPMPPVADSDGPQFRAPASSLAVDRSKLKGRKIAENHNLTIRTEPDNLKARFDRDMQGCLARGCEVLNANIDTNGYGYINARIDPEALGGYLDFLAEGKGELRAHNVYANDQTTQYTDTQARLNNLNALRDRLRKLLEDPRTQKVEDIIRIEEQLARTQQELDSAVAQMRYLQTLTDLANVSTNYEVTHQKLNLGYVDIPASFYVAGHNFLKNVAAVIAFIGAALPWLPIIFIGLWVFALTLRFILRSNRIRTFFVKENTAQSQITEKTSVSKSSSPKSGK